VLNIRCGWGDGFDEEAGTIGHVGSLDIWSITGSGDSSGTIILLEVRVSIVRVEKSTSEFLVPGQGLMDFPD